jgi:hypothetical protein
MPDPVLPLTDLTRQIAEHTTRLEQLRQQYEARQTQLAELARRQQELQAQLQQVDADIQAVTEGRAPGASATPAPASPSAPATGHPTLAALILEVVQGTSQPVTVKQLTQEVRRRGFPTRSGDIGRLIAKRVAELVDKGLLRRNPGQTGVVPVQPAPAGGAKAAPAKPRSRRPARAGVPKKSTPVPQPASQAASGRQGGQPSLRVVLTRLLQKSRRPLTGTELAEQARAAGYQSQSKDFPAVVWAILVKMDNVENVPGKGYRLKQR